MTFLVDTINPNGTLMTPINGTIYNVNQNFSANISDNVGLKNATVFIYNASNYLTNQTTTNTPTNPITALIGIVVNLADNVYTWFYQIFDFAGNSFTTNNNTVTIDKTLPIVSIITLTPNPAQYTIDNIIFNWTATDLHLDDAYFNVTNSSGAIIISNNRTHWLNISAATFPVPDDYTFIVWANDTAGNNASTPSILGVVTVIDTTAPSLNITVPINNSYYSASSVNVTLTLLSYDPSNVTSAWWTENGTTNHTINVVNNVTGTFDMIWNQSTGSQSYNIQICVKDKYLNQKCEYRYITFTIPAPEITSGGSAGFVIATQNYTGNRTVSNLFNIETPGLIKFFNNILNWGAYKMNPKNQTFGLITVWAIIFCLIFIIPINNFFSKRIKLRREFK